MFDLQEVAALLHIHEKALGHPKLKPLADAAQMQLEAVAEDTAKKLAAAKAEAAKKAEAEAAKNAAAKEDEADTDADKKHYAEQAAKAKQQSSVAVGRRL